MKFAKKITAVLLAGLTLGAFSGAALASSRLDTILEEGVITLCTSPYYAPYEFIDNTKSGQEQYVGSDMALGRYIAQKLGVKLEIVPMEFSAVLAAIARGKYDIAIGALTYTPKRAKSMELSAAYKKGAEQGIMVRKENAKKYSSMADFNNSNVTISFHSGSLQEQLVQMQLPKATQHIFDTVQNAVLALVAGKVDAVAVAIPNGELYVQANPELEILPYRFEQEVSGLVVAAQKGETELVARISQIITEVVEKDLYTTWTNEAQAIAATLGVSK